MPIDWMKFLQILIASLNDCLNPPANAAEAQQWVIANPLPGQRRIQLALDELGHDLKLGRRERREYVKEYSGPCMRMVCNCDCDTLTRLATGELKSPPEI